MIFLPKVIDYVLLTFKILIFDLIKASYASMHGRLIRNNQEGTHTSNNRTIWGNIIGVKPIDGGVNVKIQDLKKEKGT